MPTTRSPVTLRLAQEVRRSFTKDLGTQFETLTVAERIVRTVVNLTDAVRERRESKPALRRSRGVTPQKGHPEDGRSPDAPSRIDDAALIEQSRHRPDLFAVLYDRYFGEIHRYVGGRLGTQIADDLAAETFLVAFRKRQSFDPARGAIRPWLYGIATNLVAQHRRSETRRLEALQRTPAYGTADDGHEDSVATRVTAASAQGRLAAELGRLPDGDRDVLILVALADLSHEEVAQSRRTGRNGGNRGNGAGDAFGLSTGCGLSTVGSPRPVVPAMTRHDLAMASRSRPRLYVADAVGPVRQASTGKAGEFARKRRAGGEIP